MMLQRVAEPAFPPGSRAEGPENGRNGSFGGAFEHLCTSEKGVRKIEILI